MDTADIGKIGPQYQWTRSTHIKGSKECYGWPHSQRWAAVATVPLPVGKMQAHERFKRMLFTRTKCHIWILGVIPFTKLQKNQSQNQNDTWTTVKRWKKCDVQLRPLSAFGWARLFSFPAFGRILGLPTDILFPYAAAKNVDRTQTLLVTLCRKMPLVDAKFGYKKWSGWGQVLLQKVEWLRQNLVTKGWVVDVKFSYKKLSIWGKVWLQKVEWLRQNLVTKGRVADAKFGYKGLSSWYQVWLQKVEWFRRYFLEKAQTHGQTNIWTCIHSDSSITLPPHPYPTLLQRV